MGEGGIESSGAQGNPVTVLRAVQPGLVRQGQAVGASPFMKCWNGAQWSWGHVGKLWPASVAVS